jgi:putative transposase
VGGRGRLHGVDERRRVLALIDEAMNAGARQKAACAELDLDARTVQRWREQNIGEDRRHGPLTEPRNKLRKGQRDRLLVVLNGREYRDLSPKQVVPLLADEGQYIGSESTAYRLLRAEGLMQHRERSRVRACSQTTELVASAPNRVWSWDITYLPLEPRGTFCYLYLFVDIYSRYIVGWEVHEVENMELSSSLVVNICRERGIDSKELRLHSDNGGPMRGVTMLKTLQELGIVPSFSRPRVSDDNPYSESLFRTMKYRPEYPRKPFISQEEARAWVNNFVTWYNTVHLHSAIKFVTPEDRYYGRDIDILAARHRVYEVAREKNPERWSRNTRNWEPIEKVILNPENGKKAVVDVRKAA